jgi:N-acetylmuramoyl-L-alanine amidase
MTTEYKVKPGDHLSRIAHDYGFADFKTIWEHGDNAALRQKRTNPNVLQPGDVVHVPDRELGTESAATERKHTFKVKSTGLRLVLTIQDGSGRSVPDADCILRLDGKQFELKTDSSGVIDHPIPRDAENARLIAKHAESGTDLDVELLIGHLDPAETHGGAAARLNNMGYFAGDGKDAAALAEAVEEFQCDHQLKVDGILGPQTIKKLTDVHGC